MPQTSIFQMPLSRQLVKISAHSQELKVVLVGMAPNRWESSGVVGPSPCGYCSVAARGPIDHDIALRRMDSAGATLTTTEAALFEWCGRAGSAEFKQISQLVREQPPQ